MTWRFCPDPTSNDLVSPSSLRSLGEIKLVNHCDNNVEDSLESQVKKSDSSISQKIKSFNEDKSKKTLEIFRRKRSQKVTISSKNALIQPGIHQYQKN